MGHHRAPQPDRRSAQQGWLRVSARRGAIRREAGLAVGAAVIAALCGTAAPTTALTATPTMTPTPRVMQISGRIFDASQGPSAGIADARVAYAQHGERASLRTDAEGEFSFTLTANDSAYVPIWVSKEGFVPILRPFKAADLRTAGSIEIGLQPGPERTEASIFGRVYDASIGFERVIAGAQIHYRYNGSGIYPNSEGTLFSDDNGLYGLTLDVGPGDSVDFTVEADGFATLRRNITAFQLLTSSTTPFGLAPLGGGLQIEPPSTTFTCRGEFDITISNIQPGETLVILGIELHHGYSQGDYGTGFSWDLGDLEFPILLEHGEQLAIPVSYIPSDYPSRLHVTVNSGARYDTGGGVYRSVIGEGCPSTPTPAATNTPTPTGTPVHTEPTGGHRVWGVVDRDPYCGQEAAVTVTLESIGSDLPPRSLVVPASNEFSFDGVPDGDYVVRADSECQPSYAPPQEVYVRGSDAYQPIDFDVTCPPVIAIDPQQGARGTIVTLRGRCYYIHSGARGDIYHHAERVGSVNGETSGHYTTQIRIPIDADRGLYRIEARTLGGEVMGTADFFVDDLLPAECPGDCDGDRHVSVEELITGVRIARGDAPGDCHGFVLVDRMRGTSIAELVAAVASALNGCD